MFDDISNMFTLKLSLNDKITFTRIYPIFYTRIYSIYGERSGSRIRLQKQVLVRDPD